MSYPFQSHEDSAGYKQYLKYQEGMKNAWQIIKVK